MADTSFKKDSILDYSNYSLISLLSNIEKIVEKLMYKTLYTFLNNNNVIYNLYTVWIYATIFYILIYYILHLGNNILHLNILHSTSLINITENIRKALDDGNIGCGVFVDF